MLVSRQFLPLFAICLLLASALVFVPVSAASSLNIDVEAYHNEYSFASVNGTASFVVTITNDGDIDFTSVFIEASFNDQSWLADNVTFTTSASTDRGGIDLGSLASTALVQVNVDVVVGYGAKIPMSKDVHMNLVVTADSIEYDVPDTVIYVSNWIAYQSEFPGSPAVNTYDIGDSYDYQLIVENIAVEKLPDNTTPAIAIDDTITVQFGGLNGWTVSCVTDDDPPVTCPGWDPLGGTLSGLTAGQKHTWNITIELSSKVKAGESVLDFQAYSLDDFGMQNYQPFGMLNIPVSASEMFGIKLDGSGSREVDLSAGASVAEWTVKVSNLGNTDDAFTIDWDDAGILAGWNLNFDASESMVTDSISWNGFYSFEVVLSVPSDASAGDVATFSMSAVSNGDNTQTATQDFTATVNQHYGVSLSVDSESKEKAPSQTIDFIYNITNTGNGPDTFSLSVAGPSVWNPDLGDVNNISVGAVSSSQFTLTVTIPSDRDAGASSGNITVTVLSSDGESTANSTVSVSTTHVYDIGLAYVSGSDGTVKITQETQMQLKLNITNDGNGIDTLSLALTDAAPSWAALGLETMQIGRGQTQTITITLSPDASALAGQDGYSFEVVVTSADGTEWTSPSFAVDIEAKNTEGDDGPTKVTLDDDEDDSSTPGFGLITSLLALTTLVVLRRRA